jgi:hypothetical protein
MSRFNALIHGLTSEHVVPRVDGLSPAGYRSLRAALYDEFHPVGVAEQECVEDIASAILLNRRAKSFESARIRQASTIDGAIIDEQPMLSPAKHDLGVLQAVHQQITKDGAISRGAYEETLRILSELAGEHRETRSQTSDDDSIKIIVDKGFIKRLQAGVKQVQSLVQTLLLQDEESIRDHYRTKGLLSEADMKRVTEAENRASNKYQRAQRNLDYLQARRKNAEQEFGATVSAATSTQNVI